MRLITYQQVFPTFFWPSTNNQLNIILMNQLLDKKRIEKSKIDLQKEQRVYGKGRGLFSLARSWHRTSSISRQYTTNHARYITQRHQIDLHTCCEDTWTLLFSVFNSFSGCFVVADKYIRRALEYMKSESTGPSIFNMAPLFRRLLLLL